MEKNEIWGRKTTEEDRKKILYTHVFRKKTQGRKGHFQTAKSKTISNCR